MIMIISLDTLVDNCLFENEDNFPFTIELLSFRRSNLFFGSVHRYYDVCAMEKREQREERTREKERSSGSEYTI